MATVLGSGRRNMVLQGTFVHSKTKQELEILHNAAVAVNDKGKIVAVEKGQDDGNTAKQRLLEQLGWNEDQVDVHVTKDAQFFFPGFVGKLPASLTHTHREKKLTRACRLAHSRSPICQRRTVW